MSATVLTSWSKSCRSSCWIYPARDIAGIRGALAAARTEQRPLIPHGAGHSYTDAALNTSGIVLDLSPMRRILAWDAAQGVMRVEAGATVADVLRLAAPAGWWLPAVPSTAEATIGGCAAMNVNGKNAWKCGPFGAHVLALEVVLAGGEPMTLTRAHDAALLRAFVGGLGLLGVISAVTLQLQPIAGAGVTVRKRAAPCLEAVLEGFAEEEARSDFLEAWLDGFATGEALGRGIITCASLDCDGAAPRGPAVWEGLATPLAGLAGALRPALRPGVRLANQMHYAWTQGGASAQRRGLFPFNFWPEAAYAGYQALCPQGVDTVHAFVPRGPAPIVFKQVLREAQRQGCPPIWCVVKQHRRDDALLSYQVDGFSLELNVARTRQNAGVLEPAMRCLVAMVIEAGGRFYLAKDRWLTAAQYRRTMGAETVNAFLDLKARLDPDGVLQSDLFRRVLQPSTP